MYNLSKSSNGIPLIALFTYTLLIFIIVKVKSQTKADGMIETRMEYLKNKTYMHR